MHWRREHAFTARMSASPPHVDIQRIRKVLLRDFLNKIELVEVGVVGWIDLEIRRLREVD